MLEGLDRPLTPHHVSGDSPLMSVELDCCVLPLRNNFKLIQTTDFFYPLIDDPYTMGWITCCNVLSDLYAMGVVDCDNMLLLLCVAQEMSPIEREVVMQLLIGGFRDCAVEAGTYIHGGQTVRGPWLTIGGVASAVCSDTEYIMPDQAESGDVLVLTKALGTQVAVNAYGWMRDESQLWKDSLKSVTTAEAIDSLFRAATLSMTHLNRSASRLMHKYGAHGCTDVTGFGLLGHAENLVKVQKNPKLAFEIHSLPCLAGCVEISKATNDRFKLFQGLCPETSGGLLVCLPKANADAFCEELNRVEGSPAWIVGEVVQSESRRAYIVPTPQFIEVEHSSIGAPIRSS